MTNRMRTILIQAYCIVLNLVLYVPGEVNNSMQYVSAQTFIDLFFGIYPKFSHVHLRYLQEQFSANSTLLGPTPHEHTTHITLAYKLHAHKCISTGIHVATCIQTMQCHMLALFMLGSCIFQPVNWQSTFLYRNLQCTHNYFHHFYPFMLLG